MLEINNHFAGYINPDQQMNLCLNTLKSSLSVLLRLTMAHFLGIIKGGQDS